MASSHREALLEAAKRCLRERGYVNTTARDLVAASGTNLGSIGYHFGSKEALLNEALAELFADWTRRITDAATADSSAGPLQRAALSWVAMLDAMPDQRSLLQAFIDSLGPTTRAPKLRRQLAGHYETLRETVGAAIADALGPDAVAAGAGATPDTKLFPGTAILGPSTPEIDPKTLVGQAIATFDLKLTAQGTVIAVTTSPRVSERRKEPLKSPTRCCSNSAANQCVENPFIGKVRPPSGPWNDRMTIADSGPYRNSTNSVKNAASA